MTETVARLKDELLRLSPEEKKALMLETLPDLGREAMQDPSFLPQILPLFLNMIKQSGIDMGQLLQLANVLAATAPSADKE